MADAAIADFDARFTPFDSEFPVRRARAPGAVVHGMPRDVTINVGLFHARGNSFRGSERRQWGDGARFRFCHACWRSSRGSERRLWGDGTVTGLCHFRQSELTHVVGGGKEGGKRPEFVDTRCGMTGVCDLMMSTLPKPKKAAIPNRFRASQSGSKAVPKADILCHFLPVVGNAEITSNSPSGARALAIMNMPNFVRSHRRPATLFSRSFDGLAVLRNSRGMGRVRLSGR
jgi:hypothetical protein